MSFFAELVPAKPIHTHALVIGKKAYIYIGESTTRATSKPTNRNAGAFWYRTVVLIVVSTVTILAMMHVFRESKTSSLPPFFSLK